MYPFHPSPQVVVYTQTDGKLPPVPAGAIAITGDKANLWYAVFKLSIEHGHGTFDSMRVADDAVDTVYKGK